MDQHGHACGVIFHKPIEIPKPDSGNQYLNVLEHLRVKMEKKIEAVIFERSEVKVLRW